MLEGKAPFLRSALAALAIALAGCNDKAVQPQPADAGPQAAGLTPEQASRVLAKVGDKVITLGDFAATLERMDQFDRLRYQTKERRRELLDEIIDVELLAAEARRRGLDKQPETEEAIRQILREAMLARARQGLPSPGEIPATEVRAYYEANADKFHEPERRRVAAIVLNDRKTAERVLKDAVKVKTPAEWGELFAKHSVTAPKVKPPAAPAELAGDLGVVGPPEDARGKNQKIPEPIRAAVFRIGNVGDVLDQVVEAEGKFYLVRMNGITAAHHRSLEEADRSIRVAILQQKMQEREKALETELRKKFPVEIDDAALAKVKVPEGVKGFEGSEASPWALPGYAPPGTEGAPDAGAPADAGKK
ncbi:peptidylprolyl isomerase [Polyangium aurulentum]|uniref:peptidylprolyl isomerase n=1 Tax=Polyangium aurulentum TaxID=2567896 RepID=UPI0010AE3180|nr:peptidylprolyl isomerase [Polyangium aurulentum]UQA62321.1 peptidylprolyl isomerase [Polyangium aurulentum]